MRKEIFDDRAIRQMSVRNVGGSELEGVTKHHGGVGFWAIGWIARMALK
jgi:hypothetical protein